VNWKSSPVIAIIWECRRFRIKSGIISSKEASLKRYLIVGRTFVTDHNRHRSPVNFMVNIRLALIAYSFFEQLPAITPFRDRLNTAADIVIIYDNY